MSKASEEIIDTNTDTSDYSEKLTTLAYYCGSDLALECLKHFNELEKSFDIDPENKKLKLSGDRMPESSEES